MVVCFCAVCVRGLAWPVVAGCGLAWPVVAGRGLAGRGLCGRWDLQEKTTNHHENDKPVEKGDKWAGCGGYLSRRGGHGLDRRSLFVFWRVWSGRWVDLAGASEVGNKKVTSHWKNDGFRPIKCGCRRAENGVTRWVSRYTYMQLSLASHRGYSMSRYGSTVWIVQ